MAPSLAVFFSRHDFEAGGVLWGPVLRRRNPPRPVGQVPFAAIYQAKAAAAAANEGVVAVLLQVLTVFSGWDYQRWMLLRSCCCTTRDALPPMLSRRQGYRLADDDLLTRLFYKARPPPLPAGPSYSRSARLASSLAPRRGWGWRSTSSAWTGGAELQSCVCAAARSGAVAAGRQRGR